MSFYLEPLHSHIGRLTVSSAPLELQEAAARLAQPIFVASSDQGMQYFSHGNLSPDSGVPVVAVLPPLPPKVLGGRAFCSQFGLDYAYMAGSMAKGIASVELVKALAEEGMLAFFGAGGLRIDEIRQGVERLQQELPDRTWGVNLIHSPNEPQQEQQTVELLLAQQVRLVEAAAFMSLTLPLVRYRTAGIYRDTDGAIRVPNRVIGKVSREEVAEKFCRPPEEALLKQLLAAGHLTQEQVEMAQSIPMVDALIAEADSGGHTDNRPLAALLPTIMAVRDRHQSELHPIHIGCGGGIGTPQAAAAAFVMGADFIVTGTINQACCESGTSDQVRAMLAEARQADIAMAPAADMFEMGGKVQVLKRGTMFSMRAGRLYELYRQHSSWAEIAAAEQQKIEKTFFRASFDQIWQQTKSYFHAQDPQQIQRAESEPKHKMALVFRWYLGQSAHWANQGIEDRTIDYQIWCGPAMGAFNEWTRGSFLQAPSERKVATVALNLLVGAARLLRLQQLQSLTADVSSITTDIQPFTYHQLKEQFN